MTEALHEEQPGSMWLMLATQRKRMSIAARRMLSHGGQLALRGVPDLTLDFVVRLAHGALLAQGAESWTSQLAGHRAHRYALKGRRADGRPALLLHGLGGSASSMAPVLPAVLQHAPRAVMLELPGHGRSPEPSAGALAARDYAAVVIAALEELVREHGGRKAVLVGNSLGGALSLYTANHRPDLVAGVVGLNPAGAELSEEALAVLPRRFDDLSQGAAHMARLLFAKTPWAFWLVARDYARRWGSPTVQRVLDDARSGADRALGLPVLTDIRVPVVVAWGAEDRLLPRSSIDDFARIARARVVLIPRCGHIPQLEKPARTRRVVSEFFASLS
ncbi:MAG TPA: alpha/beta fold hydrolase [Myxococcales bacterium]|nr:alpha/beta fold hydrolase [Myxococcales bacterium]